MAMTYGAVALLGAFAWQNIPIELFPEQSLPRLTVRGEWPGASPETVEAFLTSPLESAIQQIRGVESIVSDSREQLAEIEVEFERRTDMDFARLELAERVRVLEEGLPPTVRSLSVEPYVPSEFQSQLGPFLRYRFTGPYTLDALHRHLDEVVAPALAEVDGVGYVAVSGGRERRLEVRLDVEKAASLGLSAIDLARAVGELDLVREAGVVREGDREWTVTIANRPESAQDVLDAELVTGAGTTLRVGDLATVHDTFEEPRQLERVDGHPAVTLQLIKEIGANTVRTADQVKERLAYLERLHPFGSRLILLRDESEDIRDQLSDLRLRALLAAGVIFAVLLVFLRSFRSSALVFATIGFSVLIALNLVYFGGFTLNLLTLMGLAMGFGLVVDNSIVVLENVYRAWQGGADGRRAAEEGAREVVLPILASTATTLIVFVPFVYMQGELRVFYVPLAIVVGLTLVSSLFVAFTFIPALSARLLGGRRPAAEGTRALEGGEGAVLPGAPLPGAPLYVRFYAALVGFNVRHPWLTVVVTVAAFGGSWLLFDRYVTRGRVWGALGNERTYIDVQVRLPRGSSLDRTEQLVRFFEEKLAALPEVREFTSTIGQELGRIEVTFPDSLELTAVPVAIKEQMVAYSHTFTGAEVRVYGFGPSFYGGGGGAPNYSIEVLGYNYDKVREIAEDIGSRLTLLSRIEEVDTNASSRRFTRDRATEYVVRIDRDALARHDLTVRDLFGQLRAFVQGSALDQTIKLGGEEVRFGVHVRDVEDLDVLALREAVLTLPGGRSIRLGDVAGIEPRDVLSVIHREDQQYQRMVAYEFRGPTRLGDIYQRSVIDNTEVPPGYTIREPEGFVFSTEQQGQIRLVLLVSVLLIYMVTAALFESLRQPLCVLLTVPMALIGVFLTFFYTNATFTREAYIGVIMMGGIVVNNAILLVDHVNRVRRTTSLALPDAILRGTLERVRPILMTTATTVLGLAPLVLFSGTADANIWNALGFALIGGLTASTFFVLTTTPALYFLFERGVGERHARAHDPPPPAGDRAGPVVRAGAPA